MGKRRKSYEPQPFEHDPRYKQVSGAHNTAFLQLYESMLMSLAYHKLSPRAMMLYNYCKLQQYRQKPEDKREYPEEYRRDHQFFVMNKARWQKLYKLYTNPQSFYDDMSLLIHYGFIDCVECGHNTREKTLYKFSHRWTVYGTSEYCVPEEVKTSAYRQREARGFFS